MAEYPHLDKWKKENEISLWAFTSDTDNVLEMIFEHLLIEIERLKTHIRWLELSDEEKHWSKGAEPKDKL